MMQAAELLAWAGKARAGFSRATDLALPPLCLGCGRGVGGHGVLCAGCWAAIDFIEKPYCAVTGLPFAYEQGEGAVSAAALAHAPAYARARAVMRYDKASARLVHRFKYGDRMEVAPAFARWLVRAGAGFLDTADMIAPVPLHRWRLFSRRFNQSAELCRAVAVQTGLAAMPALLVRARATRPQVGLSGERRWRNVAGAFRLGVDASLVEDRHIVLIDDVVTTGATADACARVLAQAGAREVSVLCLALVVPAGGSSI